MERVHKGLRSGSRSGQAWGYVARSCVATPRPGLKCHDIHVRHSLRVFRFEGRRESGEATAEKFRSKCGKIPHLSISVFGGDARRLQRQGLRARVDARCSVRCWSREPVCLIHPVGIVRPPDFQAETVENIEPAINRPAESFRTFCGILPHSLISLHVVSALSGVLFLHECLAVAGLFWPVVRNSPFSFGDLASKSNTRPHLLLPAMIDTRRSMICTRGLSACFRGYPEATRVAAG